MTQTPSPEVVQQAAESAVLFAELEPAVIAALITGSAAILVALLGSFLSGVIAFLTLRWSNKFERERLDTLIASEQKRHNDELQEKRTDRVFNTKLTTATELIEALNYLVSTEVKEMNLAALSQQTDKIRNLLPRVSFLFSAVVIPDGLTQKVEELRTTISGRDNQYVEWQQTIDEIETAAHMEEDLIGNTYSFRAEIRRQCEIDKAHNQFQKIIEELEEQVGRIKEALKSYNDNLTQSLRKELETVTAPTEVEEK